MNPTLEQKTILNQWFGTCRWTYNQCLKEIKDNGVKFLTKKHLRSKFLNEEYHKGKVTEWVLKTPYDVRDSAMNDLLEAFKTSKVLHKDTGTSFEINFKSKKNPSDSIVISKKCWKSKGTFYPKTMTSIMEAFEQLPDQLLHDTRLKRTKNGKFYLCVLNDIELGPENQRPTSSVQNEGNVISLDPGVRTFMTGFDPSGLAVEWGKGDFERIHKLAFNWSRLQSKWNNLNITHQKRRNLKKAAQRIQEKIKNLRTDFHCKLAKWLVENYNLVLLPKFETSNMVKRRKRKFDNRTAYAMMTWGHFQFRQRLLSKAREYPWCKVLIVDEHYTSKTCGLCGNIHENLGSKKNFNCPKCGLRADRDENAARNIYLRFLTKYKNTEPKTCLAMRPNSFTLNGGDAKPYMVSFYCF